MLQPTKSFDVLFPAQIAEMLPFIIQSLNSSMKKQLGMDLKDSVKFCFFNNEPCNYDKLVVWVINKK